MIDAAFDDRQCHGNGSMVMDMTENGDFADMAEAAESITMTDLKEALINGF